LIISGTMSARGSETMVEEIRISHPERVIDASTGVTKLDVVNYYVAVSTLILPHLAKRPVSMVRAPAGHRRQALLPAPRRSAEDPGLKQLDPKIAPELEPMIEVDSLTALIGAAQANVIEFHTWNATTRDTTRPDRMVFDLDPGEGVAGSRSRKRPSWCDRCSNSSASRAFLKTSGGKGLHVVVPIAPKNDWDTVKALSKAIVEHMATVDPGALRRQERAEEPGRQDLRRLPAQRLRRDHGVRLVGARAARARRVGAVRWDELGSLTGGAHWTIRNVHARIDKGVDPWRAYAKTRQTLVKASKALGA
jgi:bifunctional non-homologous end joining protein LigD